MSNNELSVHPIYVPTYSEDLSMFHDDLKKFLYMQERVEIIFTRPFIALYQNIV